MVLDFVVVLGFTIELDFAVVLGFTVGLCVVVVGVLAETEVVTPGVVHKLSVPRNGSCMFAAGVHEG